MGQWLGRGRLYQFSYSRRLGHLWNPNGATVPQFCLSCFLRWILANTYCDDTYSFRLSTIYLLFTKEKRGRFALLTSRTGRPQDNYYLRGSSFLDLFGNVYNFLNWRRRIRIINSISNWVLHSTSFMFFALAQFSWKKRRVWGIRQAHRIWHRYVRDIRNPNGYVFSTSCMHRRYSSLASNILEFRIRF